MISDECQIDHVSLYTLLSIVKVRLFCLITSLVPGKSDLHEHYRFLWDVTDIKQMTTLSKVSGPNHFHTDETIVISYTYLCSVYH